MPDRMINATPSLFTMQPSDSSKEGVDAASTVPGSRVWRVRLASASQRRSVWLRRRFSGSEVQIEQKPLASSEPIASRSGSVEQQVASILVWKTHAAATEVALESVSADRDQVTGPMPDVIIVADTLVEDPDDAALSLGQPADAGQAAAMLQRLSGRRHRVWSGTAILLPDPESGWRKAVCSVSAVESATVEVERLGRADLAGLLEDGGWRGKAGAYDLAGQMQEHATLVAGAEVCVLGFALTAIEDMQRSMAG